ncbi:hypothetical protein [Xanthomonas phage RTH11]|nr:hypothetical protein [Xanthomonas phage RTH11]
MSYDPLENSPALQTSHKQFMTATGLQQKLSLGDRIMDLVSAGFEDCAPDRMEATTGYVMVPVARLESLGIQIHEERKLTQFLGVALREVVPWAGNELGTLIEGQVTEQDQALVKEAQQAVTRAETALAALRQTTLFIDNTPANAFDDEFRVTFEEE